MEPYKPKRILSETEEADLGGEFLKYLIDTAEKYDPPNPFYSVPSIDDLLKIHFNNTNDLKWKIDEAIGWINDDECDYVIIGDIEDSYSTKLCNTIQSLFDPYCHIEIYKDSGWIITKINTKNKRLVISNNKLSME